MSTHCTHFLLVPDRAGARRIRRALARDGSRLGVTVGTWPELLGHAGQAYLLQAREEQWGSRLEGAMANVPDAFWSRSFEVARGETVSAVGRAFTDLMSALEPGATLDPAGETRLPRRAGQQLADLGRLHTALDGTLPDELATIRDLLAAPAADGIRRLRVYWRAELPRLNRWQAALIDKLNGDAGESPDPTVAACLEEMCSGKLRGASGSGLARLQADLYRADAAPTGPDDSVQWLGVRDYLEESEVAAGMVQALLTSDASLSPADVGLLLPDDADYVAALKVALAHGGIAVSGLPAEQSVRDLGREVVFHFLRCARKPAPAMALAACLSSPLMPWRRPLPSSPTKARFTPGKV